MLDCKQKIELYNDHFQNYKVYGIPKAQLVIADIPYNLGNNAYASNPMWYIDGDNKNGERVFAVSILGGGYYSFPKPIPLKLRLKDMLESEVDKKYYLSDKAVKGMVESSYEQNQRLLQDTEVCDCLSARDFKSPKCISSEDTDKIIEAANLNIPTWHRLMNVVLDTKGICTAINTCGGGNLEPKILHADGLYLEVSDSFQKGALKDLSRCLKAQKHDAGIIENNHRIRKLTPKECLRLMGWKDEQIDKIITCGMSNSQMYKQAGNGIVVNVLEAIFTNLFLKKTQEHEIDTQNYLEVNQIKLAI